MCDVCVMNTVKDKMLSRRNVLKGGLLSTAYVAATGSETLASGHSQVKDMTHELHEAFPTFSGDQQFFMDQKFSWNEHKFNLFYLTMDEHTGTHIDAPLHFSKDGQSVAEIPVSNLVVPLCVVDITARAADNADTQVTPDDIKVWIKTYGQIPEKACIAMNSGWAEKVNSASFRNTDEDGKQHYPGFHVEAVQMLAEETKAQSIATDTMSLDHGISEDFPTHYAWLPSGRFGIENIANLDSVPAHGATLVIGAPKHRGGSGGPARIFALV